MYCIIHRRLLDSLPHHAGSGGEAHVLPGIGCGSVRRCRPFGSLELLPHCERLVERPILAVRICVICWPGYGYSKLFLCCDYSRAYAFISAKLIQQKFPAFLWILYFQANSHPTRSPFLGTLIPSVRNFQHVFPPFFRFCLPVWLRSFPAIRLDFHVTCVY
jgi:hypothetical protein